MAFAIDITTMGMALVTKHVVVVSYCQRKEQGNAVFAIHFAV